MEPGSDPVFTAFLAGLAVAGIGAWIVLVKLPEKAEWDRLAEHLRRRHRIGISSRRFLAPAGSSGWSLSMLKSQHSTMHQPVQQPDHGLKDLSQ